jgi:hypothetical protein
MVSGLDMQGSYVGQTKDRVNELMAEAQGGVLFIDEAYTLGHGWYASEAVDQLVALMTSEEHLNKTVVILAGEARGLRVNPNAVSIAITPFSNADLPSFFTGDGPQNKTPSLTQVPPRPRFDHRVQGADGAHARLERGSVQPRHWARRVPGLGRGRLRRGDPTEVRATGNGMVVLPTCSVPV